MNQLKKSDMEWERVVATAKEWSAKNSLGFSVSSVEEEERKISFRAPCGSFYITIPDKIGAEEWVSLIASSPARSYNMPYSHWHYL